MEITHRTELININYLTKKRFSEVSGVTESAINGKIKRGVWQLGKEYTLDPDGRIKISLQGYNEWVSKNTKASVRQKMAEK